MTDVVHYSAVEAYLTKDGSLIRELMHPQQHGNRNQSLAEAEVAVGASTLSHRHLQSEELYHVTVGHGVMVLEGERFEIGVGDTVQIPPGASHHVENSGSEPLKILCCSAPPYSHDDTELLD